MIQIKKPDAPACKGLACTDPTKHSEECMAQHAAACAGGYFVKAAPQAAGAVSIAQDQKFRDLMEYRWNCDTMASIEAADREIVAHIDAHAAQRYEAGTANGKELCGPRMRQDKLRIEALESELEEWRFTNRIDELQRRCDRAEASLVRLVNVLEDIADACNCCGDRAELAEIAADALALLPAKAERTYTHKVAGLGRMTADDDCISLQFVDEAAAQSFMRSYGPTVDVCDMPPIRDATPAPAMGEELQTAWDKYREGKVLPLDDAFLFAAGFRACMALRQHGSDKARMTITKEWCERMAKLELDSDSNIEVGPPADDAGGASEILRDMLAIQEACGLHTDEYAPGSVIEYIKELEANSAIAPVSQPAAQERDWLNLIVRDIAELDYSSDTVLDMLQVSEADLRAIVTRHTAPQPITAPAGSEQEVTGWKCPNCGTDRMKSPCPRTVHECPMIGQAQKGGSDE